MKIDLIEGSDPRVADTSPGAVLINEIFARPFWGGEKPVGKRGTDPIVLAFPWAVIVMASSLAALPALFRAVRINPAITLRGD